MDDVKSVGYGVLFFSRGKILLEETRAGHPQSTARETLESCLLPLLESRSRLNETKTNMTVRRIYAICLRQF